MPLANPTENPVAPAGGTARVVVADADPHVRAALSAALTTAGLRVTLAEDGLRALRLAVATSPDVLLLDVVLEKLDGHAVCRILQAKGEGAPLVIFVSSASTAMDIARGLHVGAVDYVTKPFETIELIARIGSALRTRSRLQPGTSTLEAEVA